jgi:hypothetical protein
MLRMRKLWPVGCCSKMYPLVKNPLRSAGSAAQLIVGWSLAWHCYSLSASIPELYRSGVAYEATLFDSATFMGSTPVIGHAGPAVQQIVLACGCLLGLCLSFDIATRACAALLFCLFVSTYREFFALTYIDDVCACWISFWFLLLPSRPISSTRKCDLIALQSRSRLLHLILANRVVMFLSAPFWLDFSPDWKTQPWIVPTLSILAATMLVPGRKWARFSLCAQVATQAAIVALTGYSLVSAVLVAVALLSSELHLQDGIRAAPQRAPAVIQLQDVVGGGYLGLLLVFSVSTLVGAEQLQLSSLRALSMAGLGPIASGTEHMHAGELALRRVGAPNSEMVLTTRSDLRKRILMAYYISGVGSTRSGLRRNLGSRLADRYCGRPNAFGIVAVLEMSVHSSMSRRPIARIECGDLSADTQLDWLSVGM